MNDTDRIYEGLLKDLFSRHPSVQTSGFTAGAYKPGLSGMLRFDAALGHPSRGFRSIHVAGTNGKGSVCSLLASALAARGLCVGLYTSPHLTDFRERIKTVTDGGFEMIPRDEVLRFLQEEDLEGLSFFEITTGLAFRHFAQRQVDIAVIETGLGGRLDSTNILTPELSVVTSIGLDHCALLGDTRAKIAAEKAGIFKPGVPALCGQRDEQTAPVFEAHAAAVPCPLFWAEDFDAELFPTDLGGPCQDANLRTVLAALEARRPRGAGAHRRPHRPARPLATPAGGSRSHLRHRAQSARAGRKLPPAEGKRPPAAHRLRHHGRQGPRRHPAADARGCEILPGGAAGRAGPARRTARSGAGRAGPHRLRERAGGRPAGA